MKFLAFIGGGVVGFIIGISCGINYALNACARMIIRIAATNNVDINYTELLNLLMAHLG